MTTQSDFESDDWKLIASAPIIAAAVISASDDVGDDRDSEDEEIEAFKAALDSFESKYAKSKLVTEILTFIKAEGTEEFELLFTALSAAASHESPLEDRVKSISEAGGIVERIADKKEAKLYKKFIMDAARAVASASKEGFFVFSSSISKKEDFYLRQIQSALGI